MEIQVGPSQGNRQTRVSFPPTFTHGELEIKSPLWSQAWDSIPLVRLEGSRALKALYLVLPSPTESLGGTNTRASRW